MNITAEQLDQKLLEAGKHLPHIGPDCPYCNKQARLITEQELYGQHFSGGMYWVCKDYPTCDAYVGTHKNGIWMNYPLGSLANEELRTIRKKTHTLFDALWKGTRVSRSDCYKWLMRVMDLQEPQAHIGEMNIEQCSKLMVLINDSYKGVGIRP